MKGLLPSCPSQRRDRIQMSETPVPTTHTGSAAAIDQLSSDHTQPLPTWTKAKLPAQLLSVLQKRGKQGLGCNPRLLPMPTPTESTMSTARGLPPTKHGIRGWLPADLLSCPGSLQRYDVCRDVKPTRMQQPHFQGTFEGAEQLLPLISPFQAELEVLHGRLRLWEICKRSSEQKRCHTPWGGKRRQRGTSGDADRPTTHPLIQSEPKRERTPSRSHLPRIMLKSSSMRMLA